MKNEQVTEVKTIVLRDIEPLLKQKLGDHVVVENFTSENLVPPGENYGSTILKVDVDLKRGLSGKEEQIHLIAKMLPPTEFQRLVFNSSKTFFKEIFMYETIMPAYNKLELESGLKSNEIFNFLPKFYGSRSSLQPDVDVDDDAVFMMENLKANGYYHGVRSVGYDYEHSKVAVQALARFHALGMAVKQKKPGLFEVFKMHAKVTPVEGGPNNEIFNLTLKLIKEDPEMSVHYDKCKKVIDDIGFRGFWSDIPREPWMTIIHTDFWVNNVLFHQDSTGKIDDVKFIDFQTYTYSSALRDLQLYLFSSVNLDVTDEQLETLMDLYYETLVKRLTELKCNTKAFDNEGFWAKMKQDGPYEFIHLALMVKVLTMDVKETEFSILKMESAISEYEGNKTFVDRLRRLLLYFCKRNWLPTADGTS
ncbi:uncharacterized protein LOC143218246 [Lasioglossum baleicum]|uniref:uncharacterized protein LOC143218246 n=1 Tax=Lasioglossum baleicum TaxID=434251 RepID=UPI003FCD30AA